MSKRDLLLAIDTATTVVAVALGHGQEPLATRSVPTDRRHAEELVPAIRDVAIESGVELRELAAIVAGLGPGLFTGLRVGVTTAKAMAQALGVPTVGVSSLDVVASSVDLFLTAERVVAVLDARRREVFWAHYEHGTRSGDDRVGPPDELRTELVAPVTLAGDGAHCYGTELAGSGVTISDVLVPDPVRLLELGTAAWARGEGCEPVALVPRYVRRTDAELTHPPTFDTSGPESGLDRSNVGSKVGKGR